MTEWRLFPENTVPTFTTRAFFDAHPWIAPVDQAGHEERTELARAVVCKLLRGGGLNDVVDLGCGDGELLRRLADDLPGVKLRGYTAGVENVRVALEYGVQVELLDFLTEQFTWGDVTVMTEVLEHLLNPHAFLRRVRSPYIVVSSPSAETDEWHYEHHAWAWDLDGYRKLVEDAGWTILTHDECDAAPTTHMGQLRPQRFQVITAERTV